MKELTVISTEMPHSELGKLIEGLRKPYSGITGTDVCKGEVPGEYRIVLHDGLQNLGGFLLRLSGSNIIVQQRGQVNIENLLRNNRIPFKAYLNIPVKDPGGEIDFSLEGEPDLIYQPQS